MGKLPKFFLNLFPSLHVQKRNKWNFFLKTTSVPWVCIHVYGDFIQNHEQSDCKVDIFWMYHPSILTTLASDECSYTTIGASLALEIGDIIGWVGPDKHCSSER
jgi:hypothetical protein